MFVSMPKSSTDVHLTNRLTHCTQHPQGCNVASSLKSRSKSWHLQTATSSQKRDNGRMAFVHIVTKSLLQMIALSAVSSLTQATQRKKRKKCPMTWLGFVTWYGLRQIRGVFWTLRCVQKLRNRARFQLQPEQWTFNDRLLLSRADGRQFHTVDCP